MKEHLCDTCLYEIPTCAAKNIVWGIDEDPGAKGAEADKVLKCETYEPTTRKD